MEKDVMHKQKKGTFLPNLTKCGDWTVGLDTMEELQYYLKTRYALGFGKARAFDLENHMNNIWHNLLTKMIVAHQVDYEKDVIRNYLTFPEASLRQKKLEVIMKLEGRKKKNDISFPGYFVEEEDPIRRINKIIDEFEDLYGKKKCIFRNMVVR